MPSFMGMLGKGSMYGQMGLGAARRGYSAGSRRFGAANMATMTGAGIGAAYGGYNSGSLSGAMGGAMMGAGLGRYGRGAVRGGRLGARQLLGGQGRRGGVGSRFGAGRLGGIVGGARYGAGRQMGRDYRAMSRMGSSMRSNLGFSALGGGI